MDRTTRTLFAVVLVAILAVTGGAALVLSETATTDPAAPPGTTDVVGVIVAVDSAGLGDVAGFTLRQAGGELIDFSLEALENGDEFPPGHLVEHQATAEPVRVWYRQDGGTRLAIVVADVGT